MATVEQLTIQFEGKGASKLTGQLNSLSAAMNRLAARQIETTKATKGASKATDSYNERLTKNGRNVEGLTGAFGKIGKRMSQMRSQMLIVAFAVGTVSRAIFGLAKQYEELAKVQGKIDAVLKSTGMNAGVTRRRLEDLANAFQDLKGISNTAVLEMSARFLTFTNIVGSTFIEAQHAAADLAVMFGGDLNQATIQLGKALNDPIKGYTALRRIGVSFSAQQVESIKTFQEQGKIIEAQKVILDELKLEMGGAAEASRELAYGSAILTDGWNALGDAGKDLGRFLQPLVALFGIIGLGIGKTVSFLMTPIDYTDWTKASEDALNQVKTAEKKLGNQTSLLRQEFKSLAEEADGFTTPAQFKVFQEAIKDAVDDKDLDTLQSLMETYSERVLQNSFLLNKQLVAQQAQDEELEKALKLLKTKVKFAEHEIYLNSKGEDAHLKNLLAGKKEISMRQKLIITHGTLTQEMENQLKILEKIQKNEKLYQTILETRNALIGAGIDRFTELLDKEQERSSKRIENINREEEIELEALRNTWRFQQSTDKNKQKLEQEIRDRHAADRQAEEAAANAQMRKQFKRIQNFRISEVVMNTARAVSEAIPNAARMILAGGLGLVQIGKIKAEKPPVMAEGGLVGGNLHSQGGTMINAERGEFVISRRGVEAIGLEALNRINSGGGGGAVNVTFQGNVLSQEFIEEEAIPQIKEAVRRGADIGIAGLRT